MPYLYIISKMLPKTISENLDLILKYKSYTIQAPSINLNGTLTVSGSVINPVWPRYVQWTSPPQLVPVANVVNTIITWAPGASVSSNTFTYETPVVPLADYFACEAPFLSVTVKTSGYYIVTCQVIVAGTLQNGKYYAISSSLQPLVGPTENIIGQEWAIGVTFPNLTNTMACTF